MSRLALAGVAALSVAIGFTQAAGARAVVQDKDVQLTGCVVRDEGGDGFLLTNMSSGVSVQRADATSVSPGGGSGGVSPVSGGKHATSATTNDMCDLREARPTRLPAILPRRVTTICDGSATSRRSPHISHGTAPRTW